MKDTVALIVDPDFGARIQEVIARVRHAWVVATPANVAVAEQIWRASPNSPGLNMEGGVTTFIQYGVDRESCKHETSTVCERSVTSAMMSCEGHE